MLSLYMVSTMREIRRDDDGALLGFIRPVGEAWEPVTVFGYPLGEPCSEEEAFDEVHRTGLGGADAPLGVPGGR